MNNIDCFSEIVAKLTKLQVKYKGDEQLHRKLTVATQLIFDCMFEITYRNEVDE